MIRSNTYYVKITHGRSGKAAARQVLSQLDLGRIVFDAEPFEAKGVTVSQVAEVPVLPNLRKTERKILEALYAGRDEPSAIPRCGNGFFSVVKLADYMLARGHKLSPVTLVPHLRNLQRAGLVSHVYRRTYPAFSEWSITPEGSEVCNAGQN